MTPARIDLLPIEALFAQTESDAERAWLLIQKAFEVEEDDPVYMLELASRAREFAVRSGDREAWAYSCRHSGIACHLLAREEEALTDLQAAMRQFEELDLRAGVALVAGNLALVHQDRGRYDLALESQLRCLKLCDELGDERGRARNLLNTAEIYCALQEDERALDYCEQSLAIARTTDDHHTLGTALANIGTLYARLGMIDRALECQLESLAIKEESGNTLGIAIGLGNIAALRAAKDEPEQALGMYELSLQLREQIGDRRGVAVMQRQVGCMNVRLGKHDRAFEHLHEALDCARALNLTALQQEIHADCARLHESAGNIAAALDHLKVAVALKEEGMNRKHLKHVAALELEYDRERDKEVRDGLRRRVFDLEHLALRTQLNPHFLYNALNAIQFFLTNNDREAAHRYLSKLGRLMRASLELSRERLVPLAAELEMVELYLQLEQLRFGDRFRHAIVVAEEVSLEEVLVPPMLIQPFVENAVWHGILPRPDAGTIRIEIVAPQSEMLACIVEDDGIGRSESARLNAERMPRHRSMGMTLIADRLALLQERTGKHLRVTVQDLRNADGSAAGTRVELMLPIDLRPGDVT